MLLEGGGGGATEDEALITLKILETHIQIFSGQYCDKFSFAFINPGRTYLEEKSSVRAFFPAGSELGSRTFSTSRLRFSSLAAFSSDGPLAPSVHRKLFLRRNNFFLA